MLGYRILYLNSCRLHCILSVWLCFQDRFMLLYGTPLYYIWLLHDRLCHAYTTLQWYMLLWWSLWLFLVPHCHKKCFSEHFHAYLLIRPMWEFLWFISNNGIARSRGSGIFIFTKECFSTSYRNRGRHTNYLIHRILWISIVYNLNKRVPKMLIGILEERLPHKNVFAKRSLN